MTITRAGLPTQPPLDNVDSLKPHKMLLLSSQPNWVSWTLHGGGPSVCSVVPLPSQPDME